MRLHVPTVPLCASLLEEGKVRYAHVGCGCAGVTDGFSAQDLKLRKRRASVAKLEVLGFEGLSSVLVRGRRKALVHEGLVDEVRRKVQSELNVGIVKRGGNAGGAQAVNKRDVAYKQPDTIKYGMCYGPGMATVMAADGSSSEVCMI